MSISTVKLSLGSAGARLYVSENHDQQLDFYCIKVLSISFNIRL